MTYFYTGCMRYTDKSVTQCERALVESWWIEQTNEYGQEILYYVNNFSLSAQDATYGEDTPAVFSPPQTIIAQCDLSQSQLFSRWALMGDDFTSIIIPISSFQAVFGDNSEPKSGDIFQLSELGDDRPGGRNGKMFEITERLDEEVSQINALLGHYCWLIKAKRYEYSFEPGVSAEAVTDPVFDGTLFGRLSGGENPPDSTKTYPGSAAGEYAKTIFDYVSAGNLDDTYGDYD